MNKTFGRAIQAGHLNLTESSVARKGCNRGSIVSRSDQSPIMLQIDHFCGRLLLLIDGRISLSTRLSVPFTHILQGIGVLPPEFHKNGRIVAFEP